MPELPEVETIINNLRPALVGRVIVTADLLWERTLVEPAAERFAAQIAGQAILALTRRAKFIHIHLADFSLLMHLRMSGDLWLKEAGYIAGKHDRLILALDNNTCLIFNDARKFGRVWLTQAPEKVFSRLGPEPLAPTFTLEEFAHRLHSRRRRLKPLLLDQSFLAGMGNIYTDEALHMARLHPQTLSSDVMPRQAAALFNAIRAVLQQGIVHNGASIDWVYRGGQFQNHFRVYQRAGQPCPVCGTPIERTVVGQRGTYFCPLCQRGG